MVAGWFAGAVADERNGLVSGYWVGTRARVWVAVDSEEAVVAVCREGRASRVVGQREDGHTRHDFEAAGNGGREVGGRGHARCHGGFESGELKPETCCVVALDEWAGFEI